MWVIYPGGGLSMGGKRTSGTKIDAGESLEKFGRSSLRDAGSAVDDKVLVQAHGVALVGFEGERDTAVVADIAHLAVLGKVARHSTPNPSRPTHTTLTWGLPSGFKVTRCARAGDSSTARALSGSGVMRRR